MRQAAATAGLEAELVHPGALAPTDVAAWRAMQAAEPAFASPLLGVDFAKAVGAVRQDARVAVYRRGGQTIGMRPWHIRVTREDGGTPSLQQAVIRVLVAAAPLLLLVLEPRIGLHATLWALLIAWTGWFGVALFDPRRRALHDLAADTEIRLLV